MAEQTIDETYFNEYAYLKDRVYLDCSTMGMPPMRSRKAGRDYLDSFADNLGNIPGKDSWSIRSACKESIARLIHADADDIFLTQNTTEGNNLLTNGYPFEPGDEVILGNQEFVVVWMPWAGKQRDGVKLVLVENENGIFKAEDFLNKITPKTKAIVLSWVQSASGYCADLEQLGRVCRQKGIILMVDAIQGLGRLPMDVERYNIDVLTSSSFKGLLGVMGAGFCYCRKEIMAKIDPTVCSGNVMLEDFPSFSDFDSLPIPRYRERAARMESGTGNIYGAIVMKESIDMLLEIGIEKIAARIRELETYFRQQLKTLALPVRLLGDENNPGSWSGSIAFYFPQEKQEELKQALSRKKIHVALRGSCRVAIHYYNTKADIDKLLGVLKEVLG